MWNAVTSYGVCWEDMSEGQRDEVRRDNPGVRDVFLEVLQFKNDGRDFARVSTVPAPAPCVAGAA